MTRSAVVQILGLKMRMLMDNLKLINERVQKQNINKMITKEIEPR